MKKNNFILLTMENKPETKFSKIINNFDDIEIRKDNYINPSLKNENVKNIIDSIPSQNPLQFNNTSNQRPFSILAKTNELFKANYGTNKIIEESKNIEMNNYKNPNEKTIQFNNKNKNISNDNKVNINKYYLNNYKNNIKDILNQNKNIINSINNIINNDIKNNKLKNDYSNNNNNKYNNSYLTDQNIKNLKNNDNNEDNKENDIINYMNKNERKTYFNYNQEFQKNISGKDNYLGKINQDKINEVENNKIKNIKNENTNNNPNNIIQNFTLGKNDIITTFNQTGAFNINKDIKNEENKIDINNNTFNKPSNNNNFYFNYNNDLNKINEGIPKTFKETPKNNNILDNKTDINLNNYSNINNNNIYLNNEKGLKYNNYLNSNDLTMRNNNLYNTKFNTLDTGDITQQEKQIKLKIENETKNITNLKEVKNPLIKKENLERQIIYNEITKKPDNLNNYGVDPRINKINIQKENDICEILNQNNKNENQLKILNNDKNMDISQRLNNNYNNINISSNNYYKTYLKNPQTTNEMLNNNNINNINNINNFAYRANNFEKINITERSTPKKKSLSVENKQIGINNYIQTFNPINQNNIIKNNNIYNNNNIGNETPFKNMTKIRYESEKKYNINSYFQMKDKENNTDINNYNPYYKNKNNNEQSLLSSYNDDIIKENNENNIISNNTKKNHVSLTPIGLYRNHKDNDNDTFFTYTSQRKSPFENLIYNNNYYNNNVPKSDYKGEIVKTLSTNNINAMTQTRFYRSRAFPDSNYENDKLKDLNLDYNNNNFNFNNIRNSLKKQNSQRTISHLNFDLDKDYINNTNNYNNYNSNNYNSNSHNNNILNNTYNTFNNTLPITMRNNNIYPNNMVNENLNTCRCKCSLKKGRSYNDFSKLYEPNTVNNNSFINSFYKDYGTNNTIKKIDYGLSPNIIQRNNNYTNLYYNTFNKNNNSFNYNNSNHNHRNICEKCARTHFYNENNSNFSNCFRNPNSLRLCSTCKQMCGGGNIIKRNSNYIF